MTDMVALIRKVHAAVTAEQEQRKRVVVAQCRQAATETLRDLEIASVKAAHAGADLDLIPEIAAKLRALPCLPVMVEYFRLAGVDVTADQLVDQIIASMRAVADGRSVKEGVL